MGLLAAGSGYRTGRSRGGFDFPGSSESGEGDGASREPRDGGRVLYGGGCRRRGDGGGFQWLYGLDMAKRPLYQLGVELAGRLSALGMRATFDVSHVGANGHPVLARYQRRGARWRSRAVWAVTAALFVNNVLFYTGIGWFPSILESKGWELGQAGLVVSLVAWLGIIAVLSAHKISPLVGGIPRMVVLCAISIAVILVALPPSGRWAAALGIILLGFGMNFWFVLCMGYPARAVPVASACQAGGMIIGLGYFGGFVGPWAAGAIRDAAGDFGPALYAMAALTLVSLLTARSFGRPAE